MRARIADEYSNELQRCHLLRRTSSVAKEWVQAGGLMSYGESLPDMYHRAAHFVDRILKGAKPADLPVEQVTKFELVLNLNASPASPERIVPWRGAPCHRGCGDDGVQVAPTLPHQSRP